MSGTGLQGRNGVLAAMIFAVAMTFIDQAIVSVAVRDELRGRRGSEYDVGNGVSVDQVQLPQEHS